MAATPEPGATEPQEPRRRRRFPPFLAVPITLGLFFWLLVLAVRYANEHGLWVP